MALNLVKSTVDVLILSPGNPQGIYQSLSNDIAAIEPPIWAGILTRAIQNFDYSVRLIDQVAEGFSFESLAQEAKKSSPRLIVVVVYGQQPSASTQNMTSAIHACAAIKEAGIESPVVLIGGHPSALPKKSLEESRADFVGVGEGLQTILALLEMGLRKDYRRTYEKNTLEKIPGLCFRYQGEILFAQPASLIPEKDLAKFLPGIAWEQLPMQRYRAHNWHCFEHIEERSPYAAIYTSLGCPYRCTFCCINAPFGGSSIRCWDPNFVIQELEILQKKYGVKNLKIADEMFVLKEKHVESLCDLILERGLQFNIWAYARVDTVKPRLLDKMRRAGFRWLCLGIESGSQHVRDGVAKGRFRIQDIYVTVEKIHAAGIHIIGNYIFGLPDENLASMNTTLDMAMDLNLEFANFYSAMAYPGSKLYEIAIEKKWPLPESWQDFSQHSYKTLPLPTEHLRAGEVLAFRDFAWKRYFSNDRYLQLVEKKFGLAVVGHLKEVMKHDLKRKYAIQPPCFHSSENPL